MGEEKDLIDEKVAIVTGAGRGIGKTIAEKLAKEGAKVVVADIDSDNVRKTSDELNEQSETCIAVTVDVTNTSSINSMIAKATEIYGKVDILVNNAGIMFRTRILDISIDEWQKTMQVNLTGAFLCTQAVLPGMYQSS